MIRYHFGDIREYNIILLFHHHHSNLELSTFTIDDYILNEAPCFERLLRIKFTAHLKWNSYIESTVKEDGKMVGSLYHSRTPSAML